jgi:hypothetical protein
MATKKPNITDNMATEKPNITILQLKGDYSVAS